MSVKKLLIQFTILLSGIGYGAPTPLPQPPKTSTAPAQESRGGHGFLKMGEVDEVFHLKDRIKAGKPFIPKEIKEFELLQKQLDLLRANGWGRVTDHLERQLKGIMPTWHMVDVELRKIEDPDEATDSLILTYKRVQVADNNGIRVLISKASWDLMTDADGLDRAMTFAHEMFRSAIGLQFVQQGSDIEGLVGLLFNPGLEEVLKKYPEDFANQMKHYLPDENSQLHRLVTSTLLMAQSASPEGWNDESTSDDGKSPSPCLQAEDHCVYRDFKTQLFWSELNPTQIPRASKGGVPQNALAQTCKDLGKWGGYDDWRAPSKAEFLEAVANGFVGISDSSSHPFGPANVLLWTNQSLPENRGETFNAHTGVVSSTDADVSMAYRCVRGDFQRYWKDQSVSRSGEKAVCSDDNADCAFEEWGTGLLWSSRNPRTRHKDAKFGESEGETYCRSLNKINYIGKNAGWRLPRHNEWRTAFGNDIFRLMQQFSAMNEPVATEIIVPRSSNWTEIAFPAAKIIQIGPNAQSPIHCVWSEPLCDRSNDSDCDGVPNSDDRCPSTPQNTAVWTTKENSKWCGCAAEQGATQTQPPQCRWVKYPGNPKPLEEGVAK